MENALTTLTSSRLDISTPENLAKVRMTKDVPHYRAVGRSYRLKWLADAIVKMNMLRHVNPDDTSLQTVQMDAAALDDFIINDIYLSDLTFEEISEAFRLGLVGTYGEYYGITSISLFGFLKGYFRSPKKQRAIRIVQEAQRREQQEKMERTQANLARVQGWGGKVVTVESKELERKASNMASRMSEEERSRRDEEHRRRVLQQAAEIKKQFNQNNN